MQKMRNITTLLTRQERFSEITRSAFSIMDDERITTYLEETLLM